MNSHSILCSQITLVIYILGVLILNLLCPPTTDLRTLNTNTAPILTKLVQTKYFRIIRLNLQSSCPLPLMNKLCRSKSCAVCQCDDKDIPQNWKKTDRLSSINKRLDVWDRERESTDEWVWHVQDEENDAGQYFDVNFNVESYSGYNGSKIWQLIYEENCFQSMSRFDQLCREQKVLYRIISGLHTSISSHLSWLYRNITNIPEWADTEEENFYFNLEQYQTRVLSHPERIENLLFLYELLIRSTQQIIPYLEQHSISSDNIVEDLLATDLMTQLTNTIKKHPFSPLNQTDTFFFQHDNPHVKQYQRYIHNISSILNCVQCEKCKLFGKMQTYGIGTALKILLGYNRQYKRNQLVALFNTLNKISISVQHYFQHTHIQHYPSTLLFSAWVGGVWLVGMMVCCVWGQAKHKQT